ncbi:VOC family protein [Domibacillus robiginosus]|uniref:VOC family protein n=1 Tax=Domibacillus robiginosus TaxID=1071054 RepID=UPI00067BC80D|nr:VOC family protein [Domibacillus robiginosus]
MDQTLFTGIPGVFVPVKNLDQSADWYRNVLGLEEFKRGDITIEFKVSNGDPVLVLFQTDQAPAVFPKNLHINGNFFIFKTPDADAAHKLLKKYEVSVSDILLYEGIQKYFFFEDPDGNRLCVEE